MRKLDELRDQIRLTCDFDDKSKDKVLPHRRMDSHDSYYRRDKRTPRGATVASGYSIAHLFPDKHTARMQHTDHYANQSPYGEENELFRSTYSCLHGTDCERCFRSQELQRGRMDGVVSSRPTRFLIENSGHLCQPIAGGAPFLTCLKCSVVLQLPKKAYRGSKNQKKVQCGSCSTTIVVVDDGNKLVVSVCAEGNQIYEDEDISLNRSSTGRRSCALGHSARKEMSFSSEECDPCGSVFQPGGRTRFRANMPSSPLQVYFDYSDKFKAMQRFGGRDGKTSRLYEPDESPKQSGMSRQNSVKDGSETEIDIQFTEYINTASSLDSGGAIKDAVIRGPECSLAGMKVGSGNFNESKTQETVAVTISGNLIPDRLIKKAEEQAGPISSGHYWYDFQGGFWGVMGGPCSGIIPPFIEEFNYPLPQGCTGGKTGIFVNGRELHPKDLKLLASRGLPYERDRSYIIEISGRVVDEDTGEELENLGKLAPRFMCWMGVTFLWTYSRLV